MNEFIEQFLVECRELVAQATDDLLALEERPSDRDRLDSAFRAVHTLKGAAGIVDFAAMASALHAGENVLAAVRAGERSVTSALISDCLTCIDQVVQWLDEMGSTGEVPANAGPSAERIAARFGAPVDRAGAPERQVQLSPGGGLPELAGQVLSAQIEMLAEPGGEQGAGMAASALRVAANTLRHLGRAEEAVRLKESAGTGRSPDPALVLETLQRLVSGHPLALAPEVVASEAAEPVARGLRVEVERIDGLVSLAGELTVAKNALGYAAAMARESHDPAELAKLLKDQHGVLDRLVSDLQRSVLNIRVLPLRHVFQRFPRLVRDMVVQLGKPAHLITEGDATEADKAVVEALFEPLLHVLRNALDHGVEAPEARQASGKPPSATITLRGARDGDRVIVEVEDDGGGIDAERIRQVAVERGVLPPEAAEQLSDEAALDLIFAPGFSTATAVSAVSGRGVGMDAVRSSVERLGGRVSVATKRGRGTTVRFILPFTIMMSQVMTVEAGGQTFGIPLESIVETARLTPGQISPVGGARAFTLRDRTVPVIALAEVLGGVSVSNGSSEVFVVVASTGDEIVGLEVERLGERMEVMLKPMEGLLSGTPGLAGATLLGDGRVLIVLDVKDLLA